MWLHIWLYWKLLLFSSSPFKNKPLGLKEEESMTFFAIYRKKALSSFWVIESSQYPVVYYLVTEKFPGLLKFWTHHQYMTQPLEEQLFCSRNHYTHYYR